MDGNTQQTSADRINHKKHIGVMGKLARRLLKITNTNLEVKDAVSSYKEQWQIKRFFLQTGQVSFDPLS